MDKEVGGGCTLADTIRNGYADGSGEIFDGNKSELRGTVKFIAFSLLKEVP